MVWSKNGGRFWAKTAEIDDLSFVGGGDWSKIFRTYNFLNGLAFFDDVGSNAVDRLSQRFFVAEI